MYVAGHLAPLQRFSDRYLALISAVTEDTMTLTRTRSGDDMPNLFLATPPRPAGLIDVPTALNLLQRYPALQCAREQLHNTASEHNPSVAQLVHAIESDVALTAHALAAANRETGGLRRRARAVLGIPDAVHELGPEALAELAKNVPHVGFFAHTETISPERFRVHAVATRRAAQAIMHTCRPPIHADHVYAAAMLHDIGKLVLALIQKGYDVAVTTSRPAQRFEQERRALCLDHTTAGALLATRWGLPEVISGAIANHHTPGLGTLSDVILLADLIAHHTQGAELVAEELSAACAPLNLSSRQIADLLYQVGGDAPARMIPDECLLSRKQLEAVRALAEGKSYKQIAADQGLSVSTIRSHLHTSYHKLGVTDRAQAVLLASSRGWI